MQPAPLDETHGFARFVRNNRRAALPRHYFLAVQQQLDFPSAFRSRVLITQNLAFSTLLESGVESVGLLQPGSTQANREDLLSCIKPVGRQWTERHAVASCKRNRR